MAKNKRIFYRLFKVLFIITLKLAIFSSVAHSQHVTTVVAIGDSQVEPGAAFIRHLQRELGPSYRVIARGRRSWTTDRWIRAGDFGSLASEGDVVLISLGGNDIENGWSFSHIEENVSTLIDEIPECEGRIIYHMTIPRFYEPRLSMSRDGIHLTNRGAQTYARIVAPFLRLPIE